MRFDARHTRGGPLSVRITSVLLVLSAVVIAGFDVGEGSEPGGEHAAVVLALGDSEGGPASAYETSAPARSPANFDAQTLPGVVSARVEPIEPADVFALLEAEAAADALADGEAYEEEYAALVPEPESEIGVVEGELKSGQTLSSALAEFDIRPSIVHVIASELNPVFSFRRARPGQKYRLVVDQEGQILTFDYRINSDESVHLMRDAKGLYHARKDVNELVPHVVRMAGIVETSLYEAVGDLGEDPSLASTFANVFAWQFDFNRSVRKGDEFSVLYERMYRTGTDGRGEYVRPGRILAARYRSGDREYEALHFEPEDGRGGYYRSDGTSIERQFLTAPLNYARITSGYSNARRHPILNVTRAHHGIDYAAPRGTPVWAVADGTVVHRGRNGGFGHLVKVRHAGGYVSYYSHLSRYAENLHVGQKVSQKQVVGYIGSSGLATGPHTCFRIAKDGRYLNPFKVESPPAGPISTQSRALFAQRRAELMIGLDGGTVVAVQDAL
ncbi:MAG: peptidoglycan DD-metalloendopeptidase family protein [Myxococcota bacterium]|nr:peptidoglycan DD-metalloendopeptidase family protein [Myxococcota bacterium]